MSDLTFTEQPSLMEEFKSQVRLFFFYRKYRIAKQGNLPWEEKMIPATAQARLWALIQLVRMRAVATWRQTMKRTLDIAISLVGIAFTAPLMGLIALAIKLESKGPVLYSQTRIGLRGKTFSMLKFRSMKQDAEVQSGPVWAKERDPRITRVGNFLRKTHLDELPQFFNVLAGEMSIVGPRPERPFFVGELRKSIPHYDRRLYVKPGVTGLAQVRQRYDETIDDVRRKLRYDVLYIRKMCPLLDIKLIAMTALTVIFGTGR